MIKRSPLCCLPGLLLALAMTSAQAKEHAAEKVVYDEAKQKDLGSPKADAAPIAKLGERGVYVITGTGIDAIDDVDAFTFVVTGKKKFDFCLIGDAAEFKKLHAIDASGKATQVAAASTNPRFNQPRNISKQGLPPGKYMVEMYFGPQAALGPWRAKIAVGLDKPQKNFCVEPEEPTTAQKMKQVDWPGAISIYHGHNWGKDKAYITAIKEAGFGATGTAEWQIDDCTKAGLRPFVFIWPHEVTTIPVKHRDDKNVLCYYLSDRIRPGKWASWASMEKLAVRGDPAHPAFFTMSARLGGIDQFCNVVRGRVMEYYHYHWDAGRAPQLHFAFLEQYRQQSLKNGGVPVCRIVEVRPEDMRKTRQTVYTCLAYGVRGYRWGGAIFDVKNRDDRGVPRRNAMGEEVKSLNAAIAACSPIFKRFAPQGVYHVKPFPPGYKPPQDNWIAITGQEVLVGVFRERKSSDGDAAATNKTDRAAKASKKKAYLIVANRDAFHPHEATLNLRQKNARIEQYDLEAGNWRAIATKADADSVAFTVKLVDGSGAIMKVTPKQ